VSVHVIAWVYEHAPTDLPVSEMFVAVTLAGFADDSGHNAFPSVATLQERTHLSERWVRRALHELARRGLIAVEREATNRAPATYWLSSI
jgi:DNA-binding transcriptional regulator PaaX